MSDPDVCNIFVSRREEEEVVFGRRTDIRKILIRLSSGRLRFWDMSDIKPAEEWRNAINRELEKANLLLLVLTRPARKDFDWPIYEAGWYGGLAQKQGGRTICLYPAGEKMPTTLDHIQGVQAVHSDMIDLLMSIFHDERFTGTTTPLNPYIEEQDLDEVAGRICDSINSQTADELREFHYINPYVQIILKKRLDEVVEDTDDESVLRRSFKDAEIVSNDWTLRSMFGLRDKAPDGGFWNWSQLENAAKLEGDSQSFNIHWMRELESIIEFHLHKKNLDRQIESGFLAKDGKVWQPEIEKYRWFYSGRATVDVTFSPQPHRSWMEDVDEPGAALAANLMIGRRIHSVIEEVRPLLAQWQFNDASREEGFAKLEQLIYGVQRDGYFIAVLTHNSIARAFKAADLQELGNIDKEFREQVAGPLHSSLDARDVEGVKNALRDWNTNNTRFLKIGLRNYNKSLLSI